MKNIAYLFDEDNRHVQENISLLKNKYNVHKIDITKVKNKLTTKFDTVIQHIVPNLWEYLGDNILNIGVLESRCINLGYSTWNNRIKHLVNTVVSTRKITGQEIIMPISSDVSKYLSANESKPNKNFTFYCVADDQKISGFSSIIKAFNLEFRRSEPVELIIFTGNKPIKDVGQFVNNIKGSMRLYYNTNEYKQEVYIAGNVRHEHDAFVSTSASCLWNFDAFDAMCYGRTPIVNDTLGYQFINDNNGYVVASKEESAFGINSKLFDVENTHTSWYVVDLSDLRRQMRSCYEDSNGRKHRQESSVESCLLYSHENILPHWEKVIENDRRTRSYSQSQKTSQVKTRTKSDYCQSSSLHQ